MQHLLDIKYGPLTAHTLDLHVPESASTSSPLVVFVHGGAWRSEDKAQHAQLAARLAQRTACTVAVPNYRLSPQESTSPDKILLHPAHAEDILLALSYLVPDSKSQSSLVEKGVDAPYDSACLFLIGHSCGAHILTCIFLDSSISTPTLTPTPHLISATRGIILSEGIFDIDLLLTSFPTYRAWFIDAAFGALPTYTKYSSTTYPFRKGGETIHWLVIHSLNDTLVDRKQAESMYAHLKDLKSYNSEAVGSIQCDLESITSEHNEMLKTVEYSDFIGSFINKHHSH